MPAISRGVFIDNNCLFQQCHKLLDKALADLLENQHQTAEGSTVYLNSNRFSMWTLLFLNYMLQIGSMQFMRHEKALSVGCMCIPWIKNWIVAR